jgi:hypothetical protein
MSDQSAGQAWEALARRRLQAIFARTNRVCGRMNEGLVAIAIVLVFATVAGAAFRAPDILIQCLHGPMIAASIEQEASLPSP